MDKITLQIYNDNKLLKQHIYKKVNTFTYNLPYYKLELNIATDNNTCVLDLNGLKTEYDVQGSKRIYEDFYDTFSFSCINEMESIKVKVLDKYNQEFYYNTYEDSKKISYDVLKSISKDYDVSFYFTDNLSIKNKCVLLLDGKTKITKTFTKDTEWRYLVMSSKVGNVIKLSCSYPMKQIKMYVDDLRWDKELFNKQYNGTKLINLKIKDTPFTVVKPTPPVVVKDPVKTPVKKPIIKVPEVKPTPVVKVVEVVNDTVVEIYNETIFTRHESTLLLKVEELSWWQKFLEWFK